MLPEHIVVDNTTPRGTKALRDYLEYARSGVIADVIPSGSEAESDFEVAVTEVLEAAGYEVVPQLGVAGYRIDIAVRHPQYAGAYIGAIECDGAAYHSGVSVRDRDRIRQEILETLGWKGRIWRIWSTDWFRNPHHETQRLLEFLKRRVAEPIDSAYVQEVTADVVEEVRQPPEQRPEFVLTSQTARRSVASPHTLELAVETTPASRESQELAEATVLIDSGDEDVEVDIGHMVTYVDVERPGDARTVTIVYGRGNPEKNIISDTAPLAKALLGAVVGDEVVLRTPPHPPRTLCIKNVKVPEFAE